jgi:uncharacterized delta-60 repeat protein
MWFRTPRQYRSAAPARRTLSRRPRLESLEDRCLMSAGALDPTFGNGAGYVTTALSSGNSDQAKQVLVQPSGNIVVAGQTTVPVTTTTKKGTTTSNYNAFGTVEYNPDGSLNTAFGSGGIVRQLLAGSAGGLLQSAALEPMGAGDSKIVLAGWDQTYGQYGMALMRLNANGTLDTTFGNNGQVITDIPTTANSGNFSGEYAKAVAVTSSGQILVVGYDSPSNSVLLARYNPNGSLDTTFGSGGTATTANAMSGVTAMALQSDGKFVVVGHKNYTTTPSGPASEGVVLRYNANGSLDTTFGNGGIVTTLLPVGATPYFTRYTGVAIYPNAGTANDGKIVVAGWIQAVTTGGYTEHDWAAVRYNPDGSLDTTFGNGAGYEIIPDPKFTHPDDYAQAVAIESDGKPILVGGASGYDGVFPTYSQVARLNVDGSLDATFGNGGLVATAIGNWNNGAQGQFNAVAIQPDGKILAAGYAQFGTQHDFSLARYLPSQPQIGSFTASPNPVTSGSSVTLTAANITDGNPNATITQVAFYLDSNGDGQLEPGTDTLLGYATQSSPGVWTFTFTATLTPGTYTLFSQAEDGYGAFGDPDAITFTVQ